MVDFVLAAKTRAAHDTDIFALAVTRDKIVSASGSSALKVHLTTEPEFRLSQTLATAHKLGCHHLAISRNGSTLASVGFGGETIVWSLDDELWTKKGATVGAISYVQL